MTTPYRIYSRFSYVINVVEIKIYKRFSLYAMNFVEINMLMMQKKNQYVKNNIIMNITIIIYGMINSIF